MPSWRCSKIARCFGCLLVCTFQDIDYNSTTWRSTTRLEFTCDNICVAWNLLVKQDVNNCFMYSFFCHVCFNFQANIQKKIFTFPANAFAFRNVARTSKILVGIVNKRLQLAIKVIALMRENLRNSNFATFTKCLFFASMIRTIHCASCLSPYGWWCCR